MRTSIGFGWETQERPQYCILKPKPAHKFPQLTFASKKWGLSTRFRDFRCVFRTLVGRDIGTTGKQSHQKKIRRKMSESETHLREAITLGKSNRNTSES